MKRHAKSLQKKARKHEVQPADRGKFWVTSASSGNRYLVSELANGFQCVCDWSGYHKSRPCSHILAVEKYLEEAGNRGLSFWASEEDAKRQHRPARRLGQGLWATSRKRNVA